MSNSSGYCLMSAPLGALYTIDAAFLAQHEAGGAQLISRHATLAEASSASLQMQLTQSQRVRDDAAALGGKLLVARLITVTIAYNEGERHAEFHLTTPSGGLLMQRFKLNDPPALMRELARMINIGAPGVKSLPTPIPVTLRRLDQAIPTDAPVADWRVIGVRSLHYLRADELRPSDVLVLDRQHWLIRDLLPSGVIASRYTGGVTRLRPGEAVAEHTLSTDALYTVERHQFFMGARDLAQISARQFTAPVG